MENNTENTLKALEKLVAFVQDMPKCSSAFQPIADIETNFSDLEPADINVKKLREALREMATDVLDILDSIESDIEA